MKNQFELLKTLNNPQKGSLGEYIFYCEVKKIGWKIKSMHENRIDFIINDFSRIDVKTTFTKMDKGLLIFPIKRYTGVRIDGIDYASVELFSDGMRISVEEQLISIISIQEVFHYWEKWKGTHQLNQYSRQNSNNLDTFLNIKTEVQKHFLEKYGVEARVIYRTVQKDFGVESPDNLLPKNVKNNHTTVFVDFLDQRISKDNIRRIVAFPDTCSTKFPVLSKPTLHKEKVNLNALDLQYFFSDIEDLFRNYDKRFL